MMPDDCDALLAGGHVEEAGGMIAAAGQQYLAVRREGQGQGAAESLNWPQRLARAGVEEEGRLPADADRQRLAIGREGETLHRAGVDLEVALFLARRQVPEADRLLPP